MCCLPMDPAHGFPTLLAQEVADGRIFSPGTIVGDLSDPPAPIALLGAIATPDATADTPFYGEPRVLQAVWSDSARSLPWDRG